MKSPVYLTVLLGTVALFSHSAWAGEEAVVPPDGYTPPPGKFDSAPDAESVYYSGTTSCSGRNNRGSKNPVRGTDANTKIFATLKFQLENKDGTGTPTTKWVRVKRNATSTRPSVGPFHSCYKTPPANVGGFNGATCANTPAGLSACGHETGAGALGGTTYKCAVGAHSIAGNAVNHTCTVDQNGNVSSCAHSPSGGEAHVFCRLKRPAFIQFGRTRPAEIECRHKNMTEQNDVAIFTSPDGSSWSAASTGEATVELSALERFVVRIKNIGSSKRVKPNSVAVYYDQRVPANGSPCGYYGCTSLASDTGASAGTRPDTKDATESSTDNVISTNVTVFGSNGFCRGYVSPLMLFFAGERMPEFSGSSNFMNGSKGSATAWPEKDSQGWLLVHDKNKDGKILDASYLFGANDPQSNGFAALAVHDQNKDEKIDSNDAIFDELLLWNDKNGDGVSQRKELQSLKKAGVLSISLRYSDAQRVDVGGRATGKERSSFVYRKDAQKKEMEGVIYDVWFSDTK